MPGISVSRIPIPFNKGGFSYSSYWATRNPSNLIVTGMRDTEIDFSWTDNSAGDCTFAIYRSTDGVNYSKVGTTIAGDTTYTATGMTAGNLYYFYVKGVKSGNESTATNIYDTRFKLTVDTTKAGSPAKTFILMTWESGVYDYYVDWGEGGAEEHVIVNTNQTHVYSVDGTYQIKIRGTFLALFSNMATDRLKVTSLDNWGNIKWGNMALSFYQFQNMMLNYTDTPNLSGIVSFYYCFGNCGNIKHSFANFNMTTVDTADGMFINSNINETGTTTNYDATLISWASQAVKNNVVFHGGSSKYSDAGKVARDFLTLAVASGGKGWTITDGGHI